jgi:hypothetical protein
MATSMDPSRIMHPLFVERCNLAWKTTLKNRILKKIQKIDFPFS